MRHNDVKPEKKYMNAESKKKEKDLGQNKCCEINVEPKYLVRKQVTDTTRFLFTTRQTT